MSVLTEVHAPGTEPEPMVDRAPAAGAGHEQAQRAPGEQAVPRRAFAEDAAFVAEALGYFLVVLAAALVPTVLFHYDLCALSSYDLLIDARRLCS